MAAATPDSAILTPHTILDPATRTPGAARTHLTEATGRSYTSTRNSVSTTVLLLSLILASKQGIGVEIRGFGDGVYDKELSEMFGWRL